LSIYNNGTRGRWYWHCLHCNAPFEAKPGFDLFGLPEFDRLKEMVLGEDIETLAAEFARVICPKCGAIHEPQQKMSLNAEGLWLHEGQVIKNGKPTGLPRRTNIWSGWLGGVAASYQPWMGIVRNYLQGVLTYARTSDESPMRLATTSDAGAPYLPQSARNRRTSEQLLDRLEDWKYGTLPAGVRFLTCAVDVQTGRFVVEVWGWGVGLERWLIDRFEISASNRPEGTKFAALDPAGYQEDWETLVEVMQRQYGDLQIKLTLCDSGGKAGVTEKAYEFWRSLRARQMGQRFMLIKGSGRLNNPRIKLTWPDSSERKDRNSGGRGDVPVWQLNTNVLKDGVSGDLGREVPGPGFVHIPGWINQKCPNYFDELTVETRSNKGWESPPGAPNEAFDLQVYNRAACIVLKAEQIDWANPPGWINEKFTIEEPPEAVAEDPRRSGGYLGRRSGYLR
jgi:phage terminase large subunit GpA-like protein